jgi:hypothetical protein
VKKVAVDMVWHVPSGFSDDEMIDELHPTCFSSCLWCDWRLNARHSYTPGSENGFVDVETFSNDVIEVQKDVTDSVAAPSAEGATSQVSALKDRASPEFPDDLERTMQRGDDPIDDLPLVESREELPEGQDLSPSVASFNEGFGTSFRGELLSVSREMAVAGGGASKLLLLWNLSEFMHETRGGAYTKKKSQLTGDPS